MKSGLPTRKMPKVTIAFKLKLKVKLLIMLLKPCLSKLRYIIIR
jgi:hypothetical protein